MFKSALALSLVLLACAARGAQAQGEGTIVVEQGRAQSVAFESLGGASVGNVNVAYIQRMRPDGVVIYGSGAGETSLELTGRGGLKKRFSVRVVPAGGAAEARAEAGPKAAAAPVAQATPDAPADGPAPKSDAAPTAVAAAPQKPAPPPQQRREPPRQRRTLKSRLEINVNTVVMSDKEDVRFASAEMLKPGRLEEVVSADGETRLATSEQREQTMTVRRSSIVTPVSILYEIDDRHTFTVEVPFVRRSDEVTAGGNTVRTRGRGLGDVQLRFERTQPRLWKTAWDGTVELAVALPTGRSVYNARGNESPLGSGHYEVGGVFGARRVFDPFTVNAAGGLIYTVPRTVSGTRVAPGLGYTAQTGFGIALSDRWVLSEQMNFTRRPNVFLSTPTDARTASTDQSYLQHGLIYRPRGGHALQMSFNLGLNSASSDYGVGIKWVYRGGGRTQ